MLPAAGERHRMTERVDRSATVLRLRLQKKGANLVLTGRTVQKLTDAKDELERLYGVRVPAVQADVSAGADNETVVENVVRQAWTRSAVLMC